MATSHLQITRISYPLATFSSIYMCVCVCGFDFEVTAVASMLGLINIMMSILFCRLKLGESMGHFQDTS